MLKFFKRHQFKFLLLAVFMLSMPAMAQEVTDPTTSADFITLATGLVNDFGLLPLIMATAVIGLGTFLLRKARSAAR